MAGDGDKGLQIIDGDVAVAHAQKYLPRDAESSQAHGAELYLAGIFGNQPARQCSRYRPGGLDAAAYQLLMRAEIAHCVRGQEALGLDVLVHGEAERNDMVEYFGEQLEAFDGFSYPSGIGPDAYDIHRRIVPAMPDAIRSPYNTAFTTASLPALPGAPGCGARSAGLR